MIAEWRDRVIVWRFGRHPPDTKLFAREVSTSAQNARLVQVLYLACRENFFASSLLI